MAPRNIHALIICNGESPSGALLRRCARECGLIIAADGGANTARKHGIRPHVIIGDLDSITSATRSYFQTARFIHITRQDSTDLEKALSFARSNGVARVTILGATGKRIDFTLGNLSVLWRYTRRLAITVAGDGWLALPIVRHIDLRVKKGTTVSLIPFGSCSGITLKGLRFPLRNARMKVGEIGVSNVAIRSRISVVVKRGKMLIIAIQENPKS